VNSLVENRGEQIRRSRGVASDLARRVHVSRQAIYALDFVPLHSERYDPEMRKRPTDLPTLKASWICSTPRHLTLQAGGVG
jgi:hypothetical protein